jgi:hypothetical protein
MLLGIHFHRMKASAMLGVSQVDLGNQRYATDPRNTARPRNPAVARMSPELGLKQLHFHGVGSEDCGDF